MFVEKSGGRETFPHETKFVVPFLLRIICSFEHPGSAQGVKRFNDEDSYVSSSFLLTGLKDYRIEFSMAIFWILSFTFFTARGFTLAHRLEIVNDIF